MKVCEACGESYKDHIDFCFNDGEVLVAADAARVAGKLGVEAGAPQAAGTWQNTTATPIPRAHRRSRHVSDEGPSPTPVPVANAPSSNETPIVPLERGSEPETMKVAPVPSPAARPPSEVDTAPLPRPTREPPAADEAATRQASPKPPPAAPVPHAPTLQGEAEVDDGSGMLMAGVIAAVLGMFFVLGSGVVLVWMSTGLFQPTDAVSDAALVQPAPIPAPAPAAPVVVPVHVPTPVPVPVEPEPGPVPEEPEPEPQAAALQPAPVPAPPPKPPAPPKVVQQPTPAPKPPPAPVPAAPVVPKNVPVRFVSEPPGAEVWVQGTRIVEATPGTAELAPGSHAYEMRLDGFVPARGSVEATDGAEASAKLQAQAPPPAVGRKGHVMVFHSEHTKSMLFVDGREAGPLPWTVEITEGPHVFSVLDAATGQMKDYTRTVTFEGENLRKILKLDEPAP